MKKILLILIIPFSMLCFGQSKIDSILTNYKQIRLDNRDLAINLGLNKWVFDDFDKVVTAFNLAKRDLLALEDLSNTSVQKAIIQPLADQYLSYFIIENSDGAKTNMLKYGPDDVDVLKQSLNFAEGAMYRNIVKKELAIIEIRDAEIQKQIDKNLVRLKISRSDYDKMSSNDKKILHKLFQ